MRPLKWLLSLILFLGAISPSYALYDSEKTRIAFVFAGSARSFILPRVYESIRKNLIECLCPPDDCSRDIFIRVSTVDNVLDGLNARGETLSGGGSMMIDVKNVLTSLNVTRYEIIDLGSKEDIALQNRFQGVRHKIFRSLDSRRYSMFINRWAAFHLMENFESENDFKYDYVIHSRLDTAWFAPTPPLSEWYPKRIDTSSKIIIHDRWAEFVSDTFAVLPRHYADDYYSMNVLIHQGIMCLGGPNFDSRSLESHLLLRAGFPEEEHELVRNELCERSIIPNKSIIRKDGSVYVFKGQILFDHWISQAKTAVYFTGYSEQILGRRLEYMGISVQNNSFLYKPLPMAIVRYQKARGRSARPQCEYLGLAHVFGHIKSTISHSSALEVGCVNLILSMFEHSDECEMKTKEMTGTYLKILSDPQQALLDHKHECEVTRIPEDHSRALNFLPFYIKLEADPNKCLTVNDTDHTITLQTCVRKFLGKHQQKYLYSPSQMFSFDPVSINEQRVVYYSHNRKQIFCLSFMSKDNITTANILGCRSGTTVLEPIFDDPLLHKKRVTVIQSIRLQTKLKTILNRTKIIRMVGEEDGQKWLDHEEYRIQLMITKNLPNESELLNAHPISIESRVLQKHIRQFCLSSKSPSSLQLGWVSCVSIFQSEKQKLRFRKRNDTQFIAERLSGVW